MINKKLVSLFFISSVLIGFGEIRGYPVSGLQEMILQNLAQAVDTTSRLPIPTPSISPEITQSLLRRLSGMALSRVIAVPRFVLSTSGRALLMTGPLIIACAPQMINYFSAQVNGLAAAKIQEKIAQDARDAEKPNYITSIHQPENLKPRFVGQNPAITEAIEHAYLTAASKVPAKNIVLVGAPGTGKSESVKYIAKSSGLPLIEVSGADLLQKNSSSNHIRTTFTDLKQKPCIIHLQDADVLFKPREHMTKEEHNICYAFFNLLDRNENYPQRATFIISTNLPFKPNDDAMARRFSNVIQFNLPDANTAQEVLNYHAQRLGFNIPKQDVAEFAQHAVANKLSHSRIQNALESVAAKKEIGADVTKQTIFDCLDAARPQLLGNTHE